MEKIVSTPWMKGNPSAYQYKQLPHHPDWGALTICDAFFNNLTAGFMVIATLAWWVGAPFFGIILPVAMCVAFVLLIVDLILLIFDLADPIRFTHSLRVLHFTSPLSVGVWGLTCYAIFLALGIISWGLAYLAPSSGAFNYFAIIFARLFTVMAAIGAVVVICYKGVVFSCSSQPGLRKARWLTSFMVADSLLIGMGLYVLLTACFAAGSLTITLLVPFLTLLIARSIAFALLWQDVKYRAKIVYSRKENCAAHALSFIIGGIVPFICALFGVIGLCIAAIIVIGCGFGLRQWIIELATPVELNPAEN